MLLTFEVVINMSYFTNYPTVNYKFGNESTAVAVQDIGAYIDLIDRESRMTFLSIKNIT